MKILMKAMKGENILVRNLPAVSGLILETISNTDDIYTATKLVNGWFFLEGKGWAYSPKLICVKIIEPYDPNIDFTSWEIISSKVEGYDIDKIITGINSATKKISTMAIMFKNGGVEMVLDAKLKDMDNICSTLKKYIDDNMGLPSAPKECKKFLQTTEKGVEWKTLDWSDFENIPGMPTQDDLKAIVGIEDKLNEIKKAIKQNAETLNKTNTDLEKCVNRINHLTIKHPVFDFEGVLKDGLLTGKLSVPYRFENLMFDTVTLDKALDTDVAIELLKIKSVDYSKQDFDKVEVLRTATVKKGELIYFNDKQSDEMKTPVTVEHGDLILFRKTSGSSFMGLHVVLNGFVELPKYIDIPILKPIEVSEDKPKPDVEKPIDPTITTGQGTSTSVDEDNSTTVYVPNKK